MDWTPWLEQGRAVRDHTGPERALSTVGHAWDQVVGAREAYLAGDHEATLYGVRRAMATATTALMLSHQVCPIDEDDVIARSRDACCEVFSDVTDTMFDKADRLAVSLPFEPRPTDEQMKIARQGIAAASQLVALVESYIYL